MLRVLLPSAINVRCSFLRTLSTPSFPLFMMWKTGRRQSYPCPTAAIPEWPGHRVPTCPSRLLRWPQLLRGGGLVKLSQAGFFTVFRDEFHGPTLNVIDDCQVPVALAERFLIHSQEPGWNGFLPQHTPFDSAIHHRPGLIPGDCQQLASTRDRLAGKKHINDKPLHKDGEPPMWFGPGNTDLDNPVLLALNPGGR